MFKKLVNIVKDTVKTADFDISGDMVIGDLRKKFHDTFKVSLRVYNGKRFADDTKTISSLKTKESDGKTFVVRAIHKVGDVEKQFMTHFGVTVQVADADNAKLLPDSNTLGEGARGEHIVPKKK